MNLFIYGTLLDEDIFFLVTGTNKTIVDNGVLSDYKKVYVENELYPFLKRSIDSHSNGQIIKVTNEVLKKIEEYEGDEYRLEFVEIQAGNQQKIMCRVFNLSKQVKTENEVEWSYQDFIRDNKEKFLKEISI